MPNDYFQQIDLNVAPAAGGPINFPLDARAMHYFGFASNGQQIQLLDGLPIGNVVLFSWRYAQQPGIGPAPTPPQADGALDFTSGPPLQRYENSHDRAHVLVWLDGPPPPTGQLCRVRISAWSKN
jgi:hypothetical protein